jgi:hypothetical protein
MEDLGSSSKEERRRTGRGRAKVSGGLLGACAGAGMGGLVAGPPGAVVGALVGTAMGAATGWAAYRGASEAADRDSQLDIAIGVHGPDLGAPNLEHPPARIGAYSREASGVGGAGEDSIEAEGPIQPPPV